MAVDIYKSCTNPVTGETFQAISFSPEAYVMQWNVTPKGYVASEHIHYNQDEIFHIKKGNLKMILDGKEHTLGPGEKITVPMGKKHVALNNGDDDIEAIVEYRPGLDQDRFVQCFNGLVMDGFIDKKGWINVPMLGYMLKKMKCKSMARPTSIPAPAFNLALNFFYLQGRLRGWGKFYKKYTE